MAMERLNLRLDRVRMEEAMIRLELDGQAGLRLGVGLEHIFGSCSDVTWFCGKSSCQIVLKIPSNEY